MHVLLTNDDGISADGLACFYRALSRYADVSVVAPLEQQSGVGHSASFGPEIPYSSLNHELFQECHAVTGSPADCVRVALGTLLDRPVDWVFSGVNFGANLGVDIYYSGTVGAAREAALHGIRSAAFSQYLDPKHPDWLDWDRTETLAMVMLEQLFAQRQLCESFWNVNLPMLPNEQEKPDVIEAPLCRRAVPLSYGGETGKYLKHTGKYPDRMEDTQTDLPLVLNGAIVMTEIPIFPE